MGDLYTQIGGEPAVDATVEEFYKRVLADPILSPFFTKVDMTHQRKMQKMFMNHVFGGKQYSGKGMRAAHAKLELEEIHFTLVAKHLTDALLFLGVAKELVDQVMATVASTHDDVMGI